MRAGRRRRPGEGGAWAQDPFGNYVVQYILELDSPEASMAVMNVLFGHYATLAQQKFSSNVVEKCLKLGSSHLNEVNCILISDPIYFVVVTKVWLCPRALVPPVHPESRNHRAVAAPLDRLAYSLT